MSSMHISAPPPPLFAVEKGKESNVWWMISGTISWSFAQYFLFDLNLHSYPQCQDGRREGNYKKPLLFATSNFQKFQTTFLPR